MTTELAQSFSASTIFGAPLKATFLGSDLIEVKIVAAVMIIVMTTTQFITQKQIMSKNQNPDVQNSQYMQTQRILLYAFPLIFMISGITFPLGVMTYWLTSNFWTMGQQFIVIRNMPTPGSVAHKAREERLAKKGKLPKQAEIEAPVEEAHPQAQFPATDTVVETQVEGVIYVSVFNPKDGRKNWHQLITAFCWAFRETADATLVLKITQNDLTLYYDELMTLLARNTPNDVYRRVELEARIGGSGIR